MQLCKDLLQGIQPRDGLQLPAAAHLQLPEKVLQFGTGVLLRGLPDYFIDKANKAGIFNGRIVMVKSTAKGSTDALSRQDNLYTLCVRGIEHGHKVREQIVNAAVSRVLSATGQWREILDCAASPDMQVIISNTTEVGITLADDDVKAAPPATFPGKLLAFLLRRYRHFNGSPDKGMVIIPTELIPDNGKKLQDIVVALAGKNGLDAAFISWLTSANHFCNSLVDRIVPGALPEAEHAAVEKELGYKDEAMIMAEAYRLWVIETSSGKVKDILSFSRADKGVVIAPDINLFRELKLRLLNGTHTLTCGLAFLAGFDTVKAAMDNAAMEACISSLMKHEIVPAITDIYIREDAAWRFAGSVLDRFRNPSIEHRWISITMQYTSKMRMRVVPILQRHYQRSQEVPALVALGFAAYLLFMRSTQDAAGRHIGTINGHEYTIQDDHAAFFHEKWQRLEPAVLVKDVLGDDALWGTDLTALKGFAHAVTSMLAALLREGAPALVKRVAAETTTA